MKSEYLFVYGTLLKDFNSYMSKFLERNSEFVGSGYFQGNLYEISWYPGAVLSNNPEHKVYGHVFKIKNPEKTFQVLDDYEGISDSGEHTNEYTRTLIEVYFNETERIYSYVYVYNLPVSNLKHISSGKYV